MSYISKRKNYFFIDTTLRAVTIPDKPWWPGLILGVLTWSKSHNVLSSIWPWGAVVSKGRKMKRREKRLRRLMWMLSPALTARISRRNVHFTLCVPSLLFQVMNKPGTWNWVYKPFWPFQGIGTNVSIGGSPFPRDCAVCVPLACTGLHFDSESNLPVPVWTPGLSSLV